MTVTIQDITFQNINHLLNLEIGDVSKEFFDAPSQTIAFAYCGLLANLDGFCNAIYVDEKPVGLFLIGEAIRDESDPKELLQSEKYFRFMGFVIDKNFRGKGIGKSAFRQALQKFDEKYNFPLYIECHKNNSPAYHLYLSEGFKDTTQLRNNHRILVR